MSLPRLFKVKKALYGLPFSPYSFETFRDGALLNGMGMTRVLSEPAMFKVITKMRCLLTEVMLKGKLIGSSVVP